MRSVDAVIEVVAVCGSVVVVRATVGLVDSRESCLSELSSSRVNVSPDLISSDSKVDWGL